MREYVDDDENTLKVLGAFVSENVWLSHVVGQFVQVITSHSRAVFITHTLVTHELDRLFHKRLWKEYAGIDSCA